MRDNHGRRRMLGAAAATVAAGVLLAPAAIPQELPPAEGEEDKDVDPWAGSGFTSPSADTTVAASSFPISGTFVRSDGAAVVTVEVDFGRLDGNVYDPADSDPCVPDDPGVVSDTPGNGLDTYDFTVQAADDTDPVWPCNGRYLLRARATAGLSDDEESEHQISRTVVVALAPPAVQGVSATAEAETVTVTWEPVGDTSADAIGYRVERAGPKADGAFGQFIAVSDDLGTETTSATDRPDVSGEYRYRVRALRRGADGPVPSPTEGSAVAVVSVTVATTSTTAPTDDGPVIPAIGQGSGPPVPRSSGGPRIPSPSAGPPTTIDTGFDQELDYGDRPLDEEEPAELADGGEGQSIIRTEGDGAGLMAPAAGALVLLGWAGHVVYLNRLAKQF